MCGPCNPVGVSCSNCLGKVRTHRNPNQVCKCPSDFLPNPQLLPFRFAPKKQLGTMISIMWGPQSLTVWILFFLPNILYKVCHWLSGSFLLFIACHLCFSPILNPRKSSPSLGKRHYSKDLFLIVTLLGNMQKPMGENVRDLILR